MEKLKRYTLWVYPSDIEKLKVIAERKGATISKLIRDLIEKTK
jgi:hypothetical protein